MSEISEAINEMRNMRESYDQIGAAAEAYNEGKPALAAAIRAKHVDASDDDSLATMAQKVQLISQNSYTIDGGKMYAKQLFGSLETPNYWNLYEILAYLLSDSYTRQDTGHVGEQFGGFLLAEYYKGYDSLALSGAGSGGAYVVSDIDPETGKFKVYYTDTTHTWATEFDGKGNRWVAYCFADAGHNFDITNISTSPRSIYIGRHVGVINCASSTRIANIVVPDGNKLDGYTGTTASYIEGKFIHPIFRNIKEWGSTFSSLSIESIFVSADKVVNPVFFEDNSGAQISSIIVETQELNLPLSAGYPRGIYQSYRYLAPIGCIQVKAYKVTNGAIMSALSNAPSAINTLSDIQIIMEEGTMYISGRYDASILLPNLTKFSIGYIDNDKTKSVTIATVGTLPQVEDIDLQESWCKNLNISILSGLTEDGTTNNITEHILKRLKQDEPDCGDGVTITLGATNLAKLTSQESIDLLDLLTNTYGYTFA